MFDRPSSIIRLWHSRTSEVPFILLKKVAETKLNFSILDLLNINLSSVRIMQMHGFGTFHN
jgi:hypothetical protein